MLQFNQRESGLKRVVIMGCNEFGISVATCLANNGHTIHIMDLIPKGFNDLPSDHLESGHIVPIIGDGTLQQDQLRASVPDSDVFIALSNKDTVNVLAAQMCKILHEVPTVMCRIDDPNIADMYNKLGIIPINTTALASDMIVTTIGS